MKPIQSTWNITKAAVCLANEWRDTIGYTVGGAFLVAHSIHTGQIDNFVLSTMALRESLRAFAWWTSPALRTVGTGLTPVDWRQCGIAAYASTAILHVIEDLNGAIARHHKPDVWMGLDVIICLLASTAARGPKEIFKAYSEIMWD